jgi:hypothetical protein
MRGDTAFERYLHDEHFRAALFARAHRERAEAIHRLLVRPLLDLLRLPFRAAQRPNAAPRHMIGCG